MPTAVLIAKSTYVWLAQLSRQYGRHIDRLDEIPDEELAVLAHRGINSLWLIGVWERSRASKTIKQLCGNSDAVASAYSLFDYTIADDLGGEAAYINLRDRAYRHGIRLASDMVPNHMGIDSPWVVEHPEWFICAAGAALSGLQLQRPRPLARRPRRDQNRRPLLRAVRCRRGLPAARPLQRRDALHLSRQRRHQLSLERHGAARLSQSSRPRAGHPDHPARCAALSGHSFRRRHDARQAPLPSPVVSRPRIERRHSFARRIRHEPGRVRPLHAARVLARSRRSRRRRSSRHAAAGRGLLAHGGLLRPHPRHASRLQQRLHGHAARRGQRQVPLGHQEHPRVRSRHHEALRQLHEQSRRAHGHRPVWQGRQMLWRGRDDGHAARPAHVRPRPDRGIHRKVRHGVPAPALRRESRPVAGRAPRARDRAAAQAPLALCRERQLPALRFLHGCRHGGRKRLCLLEPQRRRARPGRLQQSLRRDARDDRLLGGLRRQGRQPIAPAETRRRSGGRRKRRAP